MAKTQQEDLKNYEEWKERNKSLIINRSKTGEVYSSRKNLD